MLEHERVVVEDCGCRFDKVTGLRLCRCSRHDHATAMDLACDPPALGQLWPALRDLADDSGAFGRYALMRFGGRRSDRWRLVPIRGSDLRLYAELDYRDLVLQVRQGAVALLDPCGTLLAWYASPRLRSSW